MAKAKPTPQVNPLSEYIAMVPLANLYIHPLNIRSEPPAADIEALADSIGSVGLLQNLAGFMDPDTSAGEVPQIGIVAGGRRLRALKVLAAKEGRDMESVTVPVKVTADEETARYWATAENTARAQPHPADEVRAYGRMAASGADVNKIARAFAVSERRVAQRLKLAALPDRAMAALRAGEISIDQAAGLTYAPDEESCLRVLGEVLTSQWHMNADRIRSKFIAAGITANDRRVKFIGLDSYRAAGGQVQEDLFLEETHILDESVLQGLFDARLERAAEAERERGWKWVVVLQEHYLSYTHHEKFDQIRRIPVELPDADADELAELQGRGEGEELTDAEIDRMNDLEDRMAGDFSEADIATSGVWIYVTNEGELKTSSPYRKRSDRPSATGEEPTGSVTISKPETLSQSVCDDFTILRRLSIQTALLDQPELLLDLLALTLSGRIAPYARPIAIGPTPQQLTPSKPDGTIISDRLASALSESRDDTRPDLHAGLLAEVQALGKAARDGKIAHALAALWCFGMQARNRDDFTAHIAQLTGAHVRKIWTPSAENFFSRIPVSMLERIWAELVPYEKYSLQAFMDLKKGEKAKELGKLFGSQDFREACKLSREECARIDAWLPPELRWPEAEGFDEHVAA